MLIIPQLMTEKKCCDVMQEVCICRKPWNLSISEKYSETLNVLLLAHSCIPPTANYSLFFFLTSLKLYHFQDVLIITRTPAVARILAITLEKKNCQYKIYTKMRGGDMMVCGVFV